MNITPKKLLIIITTMLAGIAFMASCSKQSEMKAEKRGKKPAVANREKPISPDENNVFVAVRSGQNVELNWRLDLPDAKIRHINILRSSTPKGGQKKVAELEPDATSFQDSLPDEYAYWYWLKLGEEDRRGREIGPVRVGLDKAGSAGYINMEAKYVITITRTDDFATIIWDFPEGEVYKHIKITRSLRPASASSKTAGGGSVLTTTEGKSKNINALPDPNAEYWYWFQIALKSGAIIHKGPIKAEYGNH